MGMEMDAFPRDGDDKKDGYRVTLYTVGHIAYITRFYLVLASMFIMPWTFLVTKSTTLRTNWDVDKFASVHHHPKSRLQVSNALKLQNCTGDSLNSVRDAGPLILYSLIQ